MVTAIKVKRQCSIAGCSREHRAKGYCHAHYRTFITRGGKLPKVLEPGPNFYAVKALLGTTPRPSAGEIARQLHISRQRVSQLAKQIARDDDRKGTPQG